MRTGQFEHAMMLTMTKDDIDTSTMLGRFLWLVKYRAGGNQRELSRMIGKTKESEGFIGAKIAAFKKDPNAPIGSDTLAALCKACSVNMQWLATGDEPRDAVPEPEPDRSAAPGNRHGATQPRPAPPGFPSGRPFPRRSVRLDTVETGAVPAELTIRRVAS